MFTGIIETLGNVTALRSEATNLHLTVESTIAPELQVDQSVSHNGVCLTVVAIEGNQYTVTAVKETLDRTNLGDLVQGSVLNLERCTQLGARLDGHIVQGHVDTTGIVRVVNDQDGSWEVYVDYDPSAGVTVEKGSISVNGVSLTVVDSGDGFFSVAIIPYTWEHTNFHTFQPGTRVNLEFDIIGKYVERLLAQRNA